MASPIPPITSWSSAQPVGPDQALHADPHPHRFEYYQPSTFASDSESEYPDGTMSAFTCATRLTILRAPVSAATPGASAPASPALSLASFRSGKSLAFPFGSSGPGSALAISPSPSARSEGYFSNGGYMPFEPAAERPRVPTKIMSPHEVQGQLASLSLEAECAAPAEETEGDLAADGVRPVRIPGTVSPPHSAYHAPSASAGTTPGSLAPLPLTPLDADVYLPFADRSAEAPALLEHPINANIKARLQRTPVWDELEGKLRQSRSEEDDATWVAGLEGLVKGKAQDPAGWVQLRGLLGADDVPVAEGRYQDEPRAEGLRIVSFGEGEPVIRPRSLSNASNPAAACSPVQQANALGLTGALGLRRKTSLESVFFSDSGSEAGGPVPCSPVAASAPAPIGGWTPPSRGSGGAALPGPSGRRHTRTLSHGGAVASGNGLHMEPINEDEVLEPSPPSPASTSGLARAQSSGGGGGGRRSRPRSVGNGDYSPSGGGRALGLRISALSHPVGAHPDPGSAASRSASGSDDEASEAAFRAARGACAYPPRASMAQSGRPQRNRRVRYSFGAVDAEKLGLGLEVSAAAAEEEGEPGRGHAGQAVSVSQNGSG